MVSTAARVGSINVLLSTQLGPGVAGLNKFASAVDRTGTTVSQRVASMDRSVHGLNRTMAGLNARGLTSITVGALRASTALDQMRGLALATGVAMGGLVPAAIGASMISVVDGAHRMSNQLRTVTSDSKDLKNTQDALYAVAQRTRSAFDGTVTIYARTARATEHLGLSQQKLLRITETVQKSFAIGGASAAEAQGAAIQLSQGIASNRFSGEEFRSVAENAPVLLRGMAESIGVTIGRLREMAHAGVLTADVVTKAILDASKTIDADFAKTTSTIEQGWVRLGNAVTKYAMDSKNASAASRAIVDGLDLVTDNVAGLVEIMVALGAVMAATFAARRMQGLAGMASNMKAARIEALAMAQANQKLAQSQVSATRSEFIQKRLAFNAALNQGTWSAKQLERQKRSLAAASVAYRTATQASTAATQQLAMAQKAASASGIAMAAAGRAATAAWAFIGGPIGAAMLAVGAAMYITAARAADAEAMSARYADAIKVAGENSAYAAGGISQAAKELAEVAKFATEAQLIVAARTAADDVSRAFSRMDSTLNAVALGGMRELYDRMKAVRDGLRDGTVSAEQARAELDRLAVANPRFAGMISDFQDMANQADAAKATAAELGRQVDELDGKRASVTITIGTREVVLDDVGAIGKSARPGSLDAKKVEMSDATRAELKKDMEKQRDDELDRLNRSGEASLMTRRLFGLDPTEFGKDIKKSKAPKKTADDSFDTSVQSVLDRVAALRLERELLGASFYEQTRRTEAIKLEQDALKKAREEARRKNDTDWQSATISAAKREEIDRVSAALAAEADATRRATEAMEFNKDILKDVLSGMRSALSDGKLEWEELGQIALNVIDKIATKLEDDLAGAIAQSLSGGGGGSGGFGFGLGGFLSSIFGGPSQTSLALTSVGLFHEGGFAGGKPASTRLVPMPSVLPQKMHSGDGMKHNELMVLLEDTENVITAKQTGRIGAALGSIQDAGPSGGVTYAPINNFTGTAAELEEFRRQAELDRKTFASRVIGAVRDGTKRRVLK